MIHIKNAILFYIYCVEYDLSLSIVLSMWPDHEVFGIRNDLKKAWMQDGTENRIPEGSVLCPGKCTTCKLCWHLKELGHDIIFNKH